MGGFGGMMMGMGLGGMDIRRGHSKDIMARERKYERCKYLLNDSRQHYKRRLLITAADCLVGLRCNSGLVY